MSEEILRRVSVMIVRIDEVHRNFVKFTRYGEIEPKVHYIMNGSKVPFEKFTVGNKYVITTSKDPLWVWQTAWPFDEEEAL